MSGPDPYRVLARKYRPTTFDALIGQEALVRTLTNAIEAGRIAQAFILTGVRGVGKTTTARLIARGLNCSGPDGQGRETPSPCGACDNCLAIAEERHPDVLEMDAASRTGIGDIREIIEAVRYGPVLGRYKIYIIDEVHMLSTAAFNGLLKTLEEPPPFVKFIFATTEIRRVPVTVLSRCQRFDLRRVDVATLSAHLAGIAGQEGAEVDETALQLIARAAEGSVRDGLSLMDQAIAHGSGTVGADAVRDMLGLADRGEIFALFEQLMHGRIGEALDTAMRLYDRGADPVVIAQDLLDVTHWVTRVKVTPAVADDPGLPEEERSRGRSLAEALPMTGLSRAWQMLMKGLTEVRMAPQPMQALEMSLIRMAYAADLPPPEEVLRGLQGAGGGASAATSTAGAPRTPAPTAVA
ncbi:DNA polymerase III subunit gamma/tau, partial [Marinibaculum pumilum]